MLGDNAGDDVARAPGGKRRDQHDRARRVGLGRYPADEGKRAGEHRHGRRERGPTKLLLLAMRSSSEGSHIAIRAVSTRDQAGPGRGGSISHGMLPSDERIELRRRLINSYDGA